MGAPCPVGWVQGPQHPAPFFSHPARQGAPAGIPELGDKYLYSSCSNILALKEADNARNRPGSVTSQPEQGDGKGKIKNPTGQVRGGCLRSHTHTWQRLRGRVCPPATAPQHFTLVVAFPATPPPPGMWSLASAGRRLPPACSLPAQNLPYNSLTTQERSGMLDHGGSLRSSGTRGLRWGELSVLAVPHSTPAPWSQGIGFGYPTAPQNHRCAWVSTLNHSQ